MRRSALTLAATLVLTACSGGVGATVAPADEAPSTTSTTLAATSVESVESPQAAPTFDTVPGTPPAEFDSFHATIAVSMDFDGAALEVTGEGVWDNGSFDCSVESGVGGFGFTQAIIATPETLWFDAGNGYEESGLFAMGVQEAMSTCPTSPLFWTDFGTEDAGKITGEETVRNGRPTIKTDITKLMGLGGLGMVQGFEGATVNEMVMWVDVETNTAVAVLADVELSAELLASQAGEDLGTGSMKMVMEFGVDQINDSSLSVSTP
ncbi:MAG: hypothetical protein ACN4GZ_18125 [Acidimicrobiales bacterium]